MHYVIVLSEDGTPQFAIGPFVNSVLAAQYMRHNYEGKEVKFRITKTLPEGVTFLSPNTALACGS